MIQPRPYGDDMKTSKMFSENIKNIKWISFFLITLLTTLLITFIPEYVLALTKPNLQSTTGSGADHAEFWEAAEAEPVEYVILLIVDGLRKDVLYKALDRSPGYSVLKSLFKKNPHIRFNKVKTIVPSVTFPANASLITGLFPDMHGIPGNSWFDRLNQREVNYGNYLSAVFVYSQETANKDLRHYTIYDRLLDKGISCRTVFHMFGSKKYQYLHNYQNNPLWIKPKKYGMMNDYILYKMSFTAYDNNMVWEAIKSIRDNGLPNFMTLYFPGNDGFTHHYGVNSQYTYLGYINKLLNILINGGEIYRYNFNGQIDNSSLQYFPGLKNFIVDEKSLYDNTIFIILSDHGQFNILGQADSEFHQIGNYDNGGMSQVYIKHPSGWNRFPRLNEDTLPVAKGYWDQKETRNIRDIWVRDSNGSHTWKANYYKYDGSENKLIRLSHNHYLTRMAKRYDNDRSGDILLFANHLYSFTNGELLSIIADHGSIYNADSCIPLIIAGNPLGHIFAENNEVKSIVDVAPTIAKLFGIEMSNIDGKPLF